MATIRSYEDIYRQKMRQAGKDPEADPMPTSQETPGETNQMSQGGDDDVVSISKSELEGMRSMIGKLQNDLKATEGRVIPVQQSNASMERAIQTIEQRHEEELAALRSQLKVYQDKEESAKAEVTADDVISSLSEEERDMFDEDQLKVFAKMTATTISRSNKNVNLENTVDSILQKKELDRVESYRNEILGDKSKPASKILELAQDPAFKGWVNDNYDVKTSISNFLSARTMKDVDESAKHLVKRINDYYVQIGSKPNSQDAITASINSAMARRGTTTRSQLTEAEVKKKMEQLKVLSRSKSAADRAKAQALYSELNS